MNGFLSPEEIAQMNQAGVVPEQLSDLERQEEFARRIQMMQAGGPQGRQAGRMYVAQNPLEQIGHFMQMRNAKKKQDAADLQRQQLLAQQVAARNMYGGKVQGMQTPGINPTGDYQQTRRNLSGEGML